MKNQNLMNKREFLAAMRLGLWACGFAHNRRPRLRTSGRATGGIAGSVSDGQNNEAVQEPQGYPKRIAVARRGLVDWRAKALRRAGRRISHAPNRNPCPKTLGSSIGMQAAKDGDTPSRNTSGWLWRRVHLDVRRMRLRRGFFQVDMTPCG